TCALPIYKPLLIRGSASRSPYRSTGFLLPDPHGSMTVRSQHGRLPGAPHLVHTSANLVAEHVRGGWERHTGRTVAPHLQHLAKTIGDRNDSVLTVFRVFRTHQDLPARE